MPEPECKLCRGPCLGLPVQLPGPQETIQVTAVVEDITCQMGAHLKSLVKWSTSVGIQRMERDLLGQATFLDPFIDRPLTAAQESRATILE